MGVGTAGLVAATAGTASASTLNGVATVAVPDGLQPLLSGGSTTEFTVSLPSKSACTGDTANNGYHVYSYLVPQGTAVTSVSFIQHPASGFGFFDNSGTYYGPANTAITTGEIINIPNDFEWGPYVAAHPSALTSLLYSGGTSGVWEGGLVCANSSGVVTDNWNTEITFTASQSDPNGFVWSAVPGPSGSLPSAITSASSTTFTEGTASSFAPTVTGNPTPTVTESGALPAGVTFSGGALSGTPTATGTFPIKFTASNGIESNAVQNFTLTVDAAPTITSASSTTFLEGSSSTFPVTATGYPTPTVTESGNLPAGITYTGGSLSGTPTQAGVFPVTFTASNGVTPNAQQSFTLTVSAAPSFTSASSTTFTEGTPGSFTPTAIGTPTPTITESGTLPTGITYSGGVLSGTPTVNGVFPVTFDATNGVTPDAVQNFTLTVDAAPVITSASSTTFVKGQAGTFAVTATGTPTPTVSVWGTLPAGVTFSGGVLSGTPTVSGTYEVTFIAVNSLGTTYQTFALDVLGLTITTPSSLPGATIGSPYSQALAAEGGTTPYKWKVTSGTLPTGIKLSASGVLAGTVNAKKVHSGGTYTFTVTVTDSTKKTHVTTSQTFTLVLSS
jgi:hypothetical protein